MPSSLVNYLGHANTEGVTVNNVGMIRESNDIRAMMRNLLAQIYGWIGSLQMISESIPNPSVGICSVWPRNGICQFGPVIPWDTIRTLCLHEACFLSLYFFCDAQNPGVLLTTVNLRKPVCLIS